MKNCKITAEEFVKACEKAAIAFNRLSISLDQLQKKPKYALPKSKYHN
jgi:hypothetical protein